MNKNQGEKDHVCVHLLNRRGCLYFTSFEVLNVYISMLIEIFFQVYSSEGFMDRLMKNI